MSQKYPGGFIMKNPTAPTTSAAKGVWTLDQVTGYVKQGIWPATPGAPTIGTATVASSTSVSVSFTAPSNLGTGAITYTATSSPGGVTGTGASPITVSGLTTGTAYTFTVTASTPGGTSAPSAASNSATPAIQPGDVLGGGFFAGQISTAGNGVADFNLVIGPLSTAQSTGVQFKTSNTGGDPTSVIDGPTNSATMNSATYPAAQFCEGLSIGGFTDWYMPAKNELEVCYYNLKPTTDANNGQSGINANAVPARASNYTAGNPAQTTAAAFQSGGAQAFEVNGFPSFYYWASTQVSATVGANQNFNYGDQRSYFITKNSSQRVRAVRRVAV